MQERLHNVVDQYELGERLRDLRVIGSPVGSIRACFDLMAYDTPDDRDIVRRRMLAVPGALTNFTASLARGDGGRDRGGPPPGARVRRHGCELERRRAVLPEPRGRHGR